MMVKRSPSFYYLMALLPSSQVADVDNKLIYLLYFLKILILRSYLQRET